MSKTSHLDDWGSSSASNNTPMGYAKRVSIVELLKKMKRRLEPMYNPVFKYKTLCFHPGDRNPQLMVAADTNTFCAFCCGNRGGGPIQLMEFALECKGLDHTKEEAVRQIVALFGDTINQHIFESLSSIDNDFETSITCFFAIAVLVRDYLVAIKDRDEYNDEKEKFDLYFKQLDEKYPDPAAVDPLVATQERDNMITQIHKKLEKRGIDT